MLALHGAQLRSVQLWVTLPAGATFPSLLHDGFVVVFKLLRDFAVRFSPQ